MNSINKNQEEENYEDLFGSEGIEKIKELVDKNGICFFCTNIQTGKGFSTRPMSVQKTDDDGNLWFLSANDSNHIAEITEDAAVQLLFKGSDYSDFLTLYGKASISKNKDKIKQLWKPILKTWFTEGEDDPRIAVIKVTPTDGYYWDTKHNMLVGMVKRLVGAAVGKTMDDSIEGQIKVS